MKQTKLIVTELGWTTLGQKKEVVGLTVQKNTLDPSPTLRGDPMRDLVPGVATQGTSSHSRYSRRGKRSRLPKKR